MTDLATAPTTITHPGVYPDMPEDAYHADPVAAGSLSSGGARLLLEPGGPARFAYRRKHPRPNTKAFDLGHVAHTLALGTGVNIVRVDAKDWKTKTAQQQRDQAYADGATPVLEADYQRVLKMVAALRSHPTAGALLWSEGDAEQSLFWIDEDTGAWCRARHDKATRDRTGRLIIVDLKTCEKADERSAGKSLGNYGYHQQADWYQRPARILGLDDDPAFVFVFAEKEPPHLINVVQPDAESLEVGRRRNNAALRLYADCSVSGIWPAYGDDIAEISLPAYYPRQEF